MKNKILIVLALSIFCISEAVSQDTTVVQTLRFTDTTKRRGFYVFPEASNNYQKVLMYHTLKCDPATTRDKYPCGEWDYIALNNVYEHKNPNTPYYRVNGQAPDTIAYLSTPTYSFQQWYYDTIIYDSTISEADFVIGTGDSPVSAAFMSSNKSGKYQMLFTAAELTAAGITAGSIDKLRFDVVQVGSALSRLHIKMKHSSRTELSGNAYETKDLQTVFMDDLSFQNTGMNDINLSAPFDWDGTSNVIVEMTFTNKAPGTDNIVNGEATTNAAALYAATDDSYLDFIPPDYIEVPPASVAGIDSFLTVTAWIYGDPEKLPLDHRLLEAFNSENRRVLSMHVPYSDKLVYFDAGHNTSSVNYDRISKEATEEEFEGSWHHWAFVKNASTGSMTIYLDGMLWLEAIDKKQPIDPITRMRIGAPANNTGRYTGYMDELRIWKTALSGALINEYMHKDVDASHPFADDLLLNYQMDDGQGLVAVNTSGNGDGTMEGPPSWKHRSGDELWKNMTVENMRPNVTFVQGEYQTHIETKTVTDTLMNSEIIIVETLPEINMDTQGITQTPVGNIIGWPANTWTYTYDPDGNIVDSTWIVADNILVNKYSMVEHQIQNYITPYGIGLSLGDNGFRWVFDVTDYLPVLHDTVDLRAGNNQELIDLKFVFISGTPPRDVVDFETIWNKSYKHADIALDNVMPAVDIQLNSEAKQYSVITRTTGHWFGGFENCAEFCPKYHNLSIDGNMEFEWLNWKECSTNPVIDQGGTWIYDRAGWCPGAFSDTYYHDITPFVTPGGTVSIDYGMEYTAGGMEGNYVVSVALVSYGDNNFNLDAAIEEIIAPNDWEFQNRVNPICADPIVVIKNTGATALTSLKLSYNVTGGLVDTYNWTGNLAFNEIDTVTLPLSTTDFWITDEESSVFEVRLSEPNGASDEYAGNNSQIATYMTPDVYDKDFKIWLRTNGAPWESSYTVRDFAGNIIMSRTGMNGNTTYEDLVDVPNGCYCLELFDSGDDGLSFFANNDGSGMLMLRKASGSTTLKQFNRNFGRFIKYWFTVAKNPAGIDDPIVPRNISVAPNPGSGLFHVSIDGHPGELITIAVTDIVGKVLHTQEIFNYNDHIRTTVNLTNQSAGFYFIRVATPKDASVHRVLKQ